MPRPRVNVAIASRYWRTPDCATPSAMSLSALRGSAASTLSARAMAPVSRCERYSTPAGERYSTDCAMRGDITVKARTPKVAGRRRKEVRGNEQSYGRLVRRFERITLCSCMALYKHLIAWKECHQLVLDVYNVRSA